MIINRHNYEEYFILYMDNELSSDDRRMVEAFIENHPDLKEELDILLQYKLEPDTNIVFAGKEELLKINGTSPITADNYEEWFSLYIDDELTADQKIAVEQFITANPSAANELALYEKTKLQPEEIVFANKELLYRKEEKVRRIPVMWWRVAAAVLILAIGLTTIIVLNNSSSVDKTDPVAKNNNTEEPIKKEAPVVTKQDDQQNIKEENKQLPLQSISNDVENAIANNSAKQSTTTDKKNNSVAIKLKEVLPTSVKKEEEVLANNDSKQTNNLPQPTNNRNFNTATTADVNEKAIASNNIQKENTTDKNPLTNSKVTNTSTPPSDYTNASFDPNQKSDDALDQSTGKKSKLRGFFRKVTRTFEKRTNIDPTDDDQRLLVGGLALRLK